MSNSNLFKFTTCILMLITMLFFSPMLHLAEAAPMTPSVNDHKNTVYRFISQIKEAQDRSAQIAQAALRDPLDHNSLQLEVDLISRDLQALNEAIEDYADIVQGLNEQDRQIRLIFNYLNLVRSNLYTLSLLIQARTDIQRIQLLDEYFHTRLNASSTLQILENLLQRYNPSF